jgi:hypothetical protein
MTSNQVTELRKRISKKRQQSRDALANVLWQKRKYKTRPAFVSLLSYYDGCATELRISIWHHDELLDLIQSMEKFNAYS